VERYFQILSISLEAVANNKFRSILTALGIIFGVGAVIAMMAIGNGARQEILQQIKLVGVNNIVILPVSNADNDANEESEESGKTLKKKYSPGLTLKDAENILEAIPTVEKVSPEIIYPTLSIRKGRKLSIDLSGVNEEFFDLFGQKARFGKLFSRQHLEEGSPVCVIGPEVKAKLFPNENPIGKHLKCGSVWLQVIGVLEGVIINENAEEMGISDYNRSVFTPIKTLLIRYKDRSLINQAALNSSSAFYFGGGSMMITENDGAGVEANQLDKIVVQVKDSDQLASTALVLKKLMMRRHQGVEDFEIKIPELLLKQEQKTKDIFNIVLGAIAGISLIVGGIGIMNIMLASVMERIREIGVRRATGATKKDIVFQFLAEATFISITGGFIGILLGVIMAKVITATTDISTVVSFWSIVISFGVAASVGIIFGYLPAKKASEQDPVESLRHD
jgi:putative ABC transport system permease protein